PSLRGLDQGESQVAGGIFEPDAHHRDVALGLAGGDARSATDAGIQIDRQSPGMAPVLEARVQAVAFTRLVPWGGRGTRGGVELVDRPDANQTRPSMLKWRCVETSSYRIPVLTMSSGPPRSPTGPAARLTSPTARRTTCRRTTALSAAGRCSSFRRMRVCRPTLRGSGLPGCASDK